jgi:hypothetical protein
VRDSTDTTSTGPGKEIVGYLEKALKSVDPVGIRRLNNSQLAGGKNNTVNFSPILKHKGQQRNNRDLEGTVLSNPSKRTLIEQPSVKLNFHDRSR